MKKFFLFCTGLAFAGMASAQSPEIPWSIGLHGGLIQYNGDRGQNFYSFEQAAYGFGGLSVSRYLGPHFDASLFMARGEIGNTQLITSNSLKDQVNRHFRSRINTANLDLRYNILAPKAPVNPYLFAGVGLIYTEKHYTNTKARLDYATPNMGAGLNIKMGPFVSLRLEESFSYLSTDAIDRTVAGGSNDWLLFHTAGLFFNLGQLPDMDKDGVSDRKDNCPATPVGVAVDKDGCPLDADKDGTADYMDECPNDPGSSGLKGCPDKDADGIADKYDRCPGEAGSVGMNGCPDADKDGVADVDDKCPNTKGGYAVDANGCPKDNDKDGIVNEEDKCPDAAGIAALGGCPDADGDGIADNLDRCPNAKGAVENHGCPAIPKEDITRITVIASKIFFETGKDKLKMESLAQLDELVILLNKYKEANLVIEGHTDNVGNDEFNMTLSQKRADAVKAYLVSKGVDAKRLTAIGYGETKPLNDNSTPALRAKNRRVELKTQY